MASLPVAAAALEQDQDGWLSGTATYTEPTAEYNAQFNARCVHLRVSAAGVSGTLLAVVLTFLMHM